MGAAGKLIYSCQMRTQEPLKNFFADQPLAIAKDVGAATKIARASETTEPIRRTWPIASIGQAADQRLLTGSPAAALSVRDAR